MKRLIQGIIASMACMEHVCADCDHMWHNNQSGGSCPKCGSLNIVRTFDEEI